MSSRLLRRLGRQGGLEVADANGAVAVSAIALPGAASQTADSNQTISAAQLLAGLYWRSGQTAGRTDTTDTGANIDTALTGPGSTTPDLAVGESISLLISNQAAQILTLAGGTGVTILSTKTTIPASGTSTVYLQKSGVATYNLFIP